MRTDAHIHATHSKSATGLTSVEAEGVVSEPLNNTRYIPGISWLRAVLSVAVVAWHINTFGKSLIFNRQEYMHHVFGLSDLINFQILLLAVPTFFLISCYLYATKNPSMRYYLKRVSRLATLGAVWTIAAFIWIGGYRDLLSLLPVSLGSFVAIILSAGHTPYYFFVSLIILTTVTHIFSKLPTIINVIMFVLSCLFIFLLPKITVAYSLYVLSAFWNPVNFLPYAFAAILVARKERFLIDGNFYLFMVTALLVASVLLSLYEWKSYVHEIFFRGQAFALPAYTRLSIVCSSILLFSVGLLKRIKTNMIIDFMSKQSLSVYCLHPLFAAFAGDVFPLAGLPFQPFLVQTLKLAMLVLVCYIISLFLKKIVLSNEGIL